MQASLTIGHRAISDSPYAFFHHGCIVPVCIKLPCIFHRVTDGLGTGGIPICC